MTYEEWDNAIKKLHEVQTLLERIVTDTKEQKSEKARKGRRAIIKARSAINELYEGVFDDED